MGRSENPTGGVTGQVNVTTSGTPVQMPNIVIPPGIIVTIKAKHANTGRITSGFSSAAALNTGTSYYDIGGKDDFILLQNDNLSRLWIDATVSGEGVEYIFER